MNRTQLVVLWLGIAGIVLSLLFPVCRVNSRMPGQSDFLAVHRYLFTWPSVDVDYGRTALQLGIVLTVMLGGILTAQRPGQ